MVLRILGKVLSEFVSGSVGLPEKSELIIKDLRMRNAIGFILVFTMAVLVWKVNSTYLNTRESKKSSQIDDEGVDVVSIASVNSEAGLADQILFAQLDSKNSSQIGDVAEIVYVSIGSVDSSKGLGGQVSSALLENGIDSIIGGSRAHSISVPAGQVDKARLVLINLRDNNNQNINVF